MPLYIDHWNTGVDWLVKSVLCNESHKRWDMYIDSVFIGSKNTEALARRELDSFVFCLLMIRDRDTWKEYERLKMEQEST